MAGARRAGARCDARKSPGRMRRLDRGARERRAPRRRNRVLGKDRDADGIPGERVTPTGAAILRYLGADARAPAALGNLVATGSGAGTRQLAGLPNILRVLGFALGHAMESVLVIEFDVDDQSPEDLA